MDEELKKRLGAVERTLDVILMRLDRLEQRVPVIPQPAPPQPVPAMPPQPPPFLPVYPPKPPQPEPSSEGLIGPVPLPAYLQNQGVDFQLPRTVKPHDADELEYKVGLNGLLRGGVAVVICAILFLAAQFIGRGYITPPIQFAGELLLCAVFITVGFFKRDEREDFGQLMVGLGSFGLYASFAGAHTIKHLFSSEVLVGLYLVLSMANLAFSHWRSSKSFLVVGLVGGLVTAILPGTRQNFATELILHFLVLLPTLWIVAKNRWYEMGGLVWVVSTLALTPVINSPMSQLWRVGSIYTVGILCMIVTGKIFSNRVDRLGLMPSAILLLTSLYAIGIDHGQKGSLHAVLLAAAGYGISQMLREHEEPRRALQFSAAILFFLVTPLGFTLSPAMILYVLGAIVLLVGTYLLPSPLAKFGALVLGYTSLVMSLGAYLGMGTPADAVTLPRYPWFFVLTGIPLWVMYTVQTLRRLKEETQEALIFLNASIVIGYGFYGASLLDAANSENTIPSEVAATVFTFLVTALSFAMTLVTGRRVFHIIALFGLTGTTFLAMNESTSRFGLGLNIAHVFLLSFWFRYMPDIKPKGFTEPFKVLALLGALVPSGIWMGAYLSRAFEPLLTDLQWMMLLGTTYLALGIYKIRQRKTLFWAMLTFFSSILLLCVVTSMTQQSGQNDWRTPASVVAFLFTNGVVLVALAVAYNQTIDNDPSNSGPIFLYVPTMWFAGSQVAETFLNYYVGLKANASVTVAWVLVALGFILAGFRKDYRPLRYASMWVFGFTLIKVFLADLVMLDPMIRVMILMVLGLCMMGGGYYYILWRRKTEVDANA
jgi:uncharacterized membrane protein